jgi:7-cyano-7-deazaguanine synthase
MGLHAGTAYIDCTPEFVETMRRSLELNTGGEVTLSAPFLTYSKADIFLLAREMSVPVNLTYSCERGGGPCGECLSCKDRECLSAFA